MRITVLMENSAPQGLIPEHGLSFYLEYRGGRYLLDIIRDFFAGE